MTMKNCTKCNLLKSLDGFYKRKRSKDGRESFCKECRLSHNRKWILDNKDKHSELVNSWYVKNKETHIASSKKWYAENKHRKLATVTARKMRCKRATPVWANKHAIINIYAKAKQISAETGIPHDVDHIIPLRGKTVSGLHVPENLQILKSADNKRKAAKFLQI